MKNKLIIIVFIILFTFSVRTEPTQDVLDAMAGASTDTFSPSIDGVAGASEDEDDEEDERDEEEEED